MTLRHILPLIAFAAAIPSQAQDLHGDVTVTADYLPTLRSHSRISPLPSAPRLSLPEMSLNVASNGVPTLLDPTLAPMQAAGWNATKNFSRYRGYLELAGGSYLDFSGSAGYRFIDSEKATVGAWLQHLSSTGFRADSHTPDTKAYANKRFDESLGVYGLFNIDNIGQADFDLTYHLGYFNYLAASFADTKDSPKPPTQTLNDLSVRVGLRSGHKEGGFSWAANLSDRYFGYRRFYNRLFSEVFQDESSIDHGFTPARENHLKLDGVVAYGFNPSTDVDLNITAGYVGYTKPKGTEETLHMGDRLYDPELSGYGHLALTPAFNYSDGNFTARLGARFDVTSTVGKNSQSIVTNLKDFGNFHVAPDVRLSWRKGRFSAQLDATGGLELRTLAAGSELYYYQSPQLLTTLPMYSPINAALTLNAGSFYGFAASVGFAYKITDNTTPDLIYPAEFNSTTIGHWTERFPYALNYHTLNVKGYSLLAALSYRYGDIVSVKADMSYQPQNGSKGFYNGPDRPRWIVNVNADVNPWSTLHFNASYQYRGVRNCWAHYQLDYGSVSTPLEGTPTYLTSALRLDDITDLSLGASYTFSDRYTVRVDASNLLGNNYLLAPGIPTEGLRIMGGVAVVF